MKIPTSMLKPPDTRPEPEANLIDPLIEKVGMSFDKLRLKRTPLIEAVMPVFGRIWFDVKDTDLFQHEFSQERVVDTGYAIAKQGVLLAGDVGVGKTTILRSMASRICGEYLSVPELAITFSRFGAEGFWELLERARSWDLFLDDLGAEETVKSYTNPLPIPDLLYRRYDLWQSRGIRTHIASNLSAKGIEDRYGLRVRDRFREMMHVIPCTGKSLR